MDNMLPLYHRGEEIWENQPFFQADVAGLGKYSTGVYIWPEWV